MARSSMTFKEMIDLARSISSSDTLRSLTYRQLALHFHLTPNQIRKSINVCKWYTERIDEDMLSRHVLEYCYKYNYESSKVVRFYNLVHQYFINSGMYTFNIYERNWEWTSSKYTPIQAILNTSIQQFKQIRGSGDISTRMFVNLQEHCKTKFQLT